MHSLPSSFIVWVGVEMLLASSTMHAVCILFGTETSPKTKTWNYSVKLVVELSTEIVGVSMSLTVVTEQILLQPLGRLVIVRLSVDLSFINCFYLRLSFLRTLALNVCNCG